MGYIVPDNIPKTKKRELSQAALDRVADKVSMLKNIQREIREALAYEKRTKLEIQAILGENEEGTINGAEAVRWQYIDAYAWGKFCQDNPGIAAQFSIKKEVTVVDEEALKASEHAGLLKLYQTRQFNIL